MKRFLQERYSPVIINENESVTPSNSFNTVLTIHSFAVTFFFLDGLECILPDFLM